MSGSRNHYLAIENLWQEAAASWKDEMANQYHTNCIQAMQELATQFDRESRHLEEYLKRVFYQIQNY